MKSKDRPGSQSASQLTSLNVDHDRQFHLLTSCNLLHLDDVFHQVPWKQLKKQKQILCKTTKYTTI